MKENLHPQYFDVKIVCACGSTLETASTQKSLTVDICSKCHPLYTGKQRLMDTEGRIDRFKKKYEKANAAKTKH